jgi:hypothetical protein
MKLAVFSIVKDAMPFLPTVFFNLQATKLDWRWVVAEGSALNTHCTSWCKEQAPGLSTDGTSEFLDIIAKHPRVTVLRKEMWDGKVEQCNACLAEIREPCLLMQMDADEIWRPDAIEKVAELFATYPHIKRAYFWCVYYLGLNVITTSGNGYGNRDGLEWLRAWRFTPGQAFIRHEPPELSGSDGEYFDRRFTGKNGITFNHYAWWWQSQVAYKEQFYGYPSAVQKWTNFQQNAKWPVANLKDWLPWVGDSASADILKLP